MGGYIQLNVRVRLMLSAALAVIAVILIYSFLSKSEDEVQIMVAAKNIEKGTKIEESFLETKTIPRNVKEEFFQNAFTNEEEVIGCVTKKGISVGQPIVADPEVLVMSEELKKALTGDGKVNDAFFIPEDSRLITIEVDNSGSINYSIKKEDFVDVIFSSVDESTGGLYSSMLLQHIEVYDVEKVITEEEGVITKRQNITLVATAQDCLKLAAGNRNGVLDLAMNPLQGNTENIEPISILSYRAEEPATKEQKLSSLKAYIESFDMSEGTKEQLLLSLDEERGIEALIEFIGATTIDEGTKDKLLKLLNKEGN